MAEVAKAMKEDMAALNRSRAERAAVLERHTPSPPPCLPREEKQSIDELVHGASRNARKFLCDPATRAANRRALTKLYRMADLCDCEACTLFMLGEIV